MYSTDIYNFNTIPDKHINPKTNGGLWVNYKDIKQPYVCMDNTSDNNIWEPINNRKLKKLEDYKSDPKPATPPENYGIVEPNRSLTFGLTIQLDDRGGFSFDICSHRLIIWGKILMGDHVDRARYIYTSTSLKSDGSVVDYPINLRVPDGTTIISDMRNMGFPTRAMWQWDKKKHLLTNPRYWYVATKSYRADNWGGTHSDKYEDWPHFTNINELVYVPLIKHRSYKVMGNEDYTSAIISCSVYDPDNGPVRLVSVFKFVG